VGPAAARLRSTDLSASSIAAAFGLGIPTGPLVAVAGGPSALHRSALLATGRDRFAVKVLGRGHADDVEASEVPVRLELAALAAGVPLPRPWNPAEEVAAAVVSWSAAAHGEPDERVARALVEGYRRAGGDLQVLSPTVLAGSLSAVANWLELNLRRSLGEATDPPLRSRAEAEVAAALDELSWRLARLDRWMALLR
jgi:hypothetical protein